MPSATSAQVSGRTKKAIREVDQNALNELIASLEPGYYRHKEMAPDPIAMLDAIFFDAACFVDYEVVEKSLKLGANINVVHPGLGATALHIAVGRRNKEMITFLIERGGSLDIEGKDSRTPLDDAWRRARLEIDAGFAEWAERAWRTAHPEVKGPLAMRLGF